MFSISDLENNIDKLISEYNVPGLKEALEKSLNEIWNISKIPSKSESTDYLEGLFQYAAIYFGLGRSERAMEGWQHYLTIAEKYGVGNKPKYAQVLLFIGRVHQEGQQYDEALHYFKRFREFAIANLDNSEVGQAEYEIGKVHLSQGTYQKALEQFNKALGYESHLSLENLVETKSALGATYVRLGEFVEGEKVFDEVVLLLQKGTEDKAKAISSMNNFAMLYQELRQFEKAIGYFKKVITWQKEANPKSESLIRYLNNLALAYYQNHQTIEESEIRKEALQLAGEILDPEHSLYAYLYNNMGICMLRDEQMEDALDHFRKAEAILGKNETNDHLAGSLYMNLGVTFRELKNTKQSLLYFEKTKAHYAQTLPEFHPEKSKLHTHLATLYEELEDYEKALDEFEQARSMHGKQLDLYFSNLSEKEKALFFFDVFEFYEMYVSFVWRRIQEDDTALLRRKCLELVIEIKSFLMQESINMHSSGRATNQTEISTVLVKLKSLRESLISRQKLDAQGYEAKLKEINTLEKKLASVSTAHQQLDLDDLMKSLKADQAIVEVFRMNYYEEAITRDVKYLFFIIKGSDVQILTRDDYNELEYTGMLSYLDYLDQEEKTDGAFWDLYWSHIDGALGTEIREIWIVPDGVYFRLSLETFYNPKTGLYVKDQLQIQYLSNSGDLNHIQIQKSHQIKAKTVSVFYPMNTAELPGYLHNGKSEAKAIQSSFSASLTHIIRGARSTASKFLNMENPDILHIITHGFFNSEEKIKGKLDINETRSIDLPDPSLHEPMFNSGLLMRKGKQLQELSAYEISTMKLDKTELVTLSACESGLGDLIHGGGIYGLIRAFRIAGAKRILVSLWQVDDKVTSFFMACFYSSLAKTLDPNSAFAFAQNETQKVFPAPCDWGGFVMYS